MERKKIGVVLAQAEEDSQNLFLKGMMEKAYEKDYDVCVFSMYTRSQDTPFRGLGESNIYNLIEWNAFDAIVVLPETVQTPGVIEQIEEKIHEVYSGIVLYIDKDSKYFPTVKMNHYKPYKALIDHLIEVHGYKDILFLNGWKEHPHSMQREQAYRDSLTEHGISVKEENIYYGDYWYPSGREMVRKMLEDRTEYPEAIACANDCMAIGVASELFEHHIEVPEQIAVIGYDSSNEGKQLKCPLTSADIPIRECGSYSVLYIDAMLRGEEPPEFESMSPLFIGKSCGCTHHEEQETNGHTTFLPQENFWSTEMSSGGYTYFHNNYLEDLLAERKHRNFFNIVFQHIFQIRPFHSFSICLNDYWNSSEFMTGEHATKPGYTKNVYRVLKCGADEHAGNALDFDDVFDVKQMIPELYEPREHAETFFFTPLYFENRSFGYAVIGFSGQFGAYSMVYKNWLKSVMQGMEAFYRQDALKTLLARIEATQVRDAMTGLYNYKGFLKRGEEFSENATYEGKAVTITAIDIKGLRDINNSFGRKAGDDAIQRMAQFITETTKGDAIIVRTGNDEFVVATAADASETSREPAFLNRLRKQIQKFNESGKAQYEIDIYTCTCSDMISGSEALDHLVNKTVNQKNVKKKAEQNRLMASEGLTDKQKADDQLMEDILDNNRFTYHFQPIINAKTGEVYAYEALMRADTERKISPLDMLESAERMNRLYEIEKATFFNVIEFIDTHADEFMGKKVFINSIPGSQLKGEDKKRLSELMKKYAGKIVVELTEETEMGDEQLHNLKDEYARMNIDTAIDDYGSGYSNINNLLRYMPRYVKIDRMLMVDIHEKPEKQHFVKDVIEFAHDNDILTLAEGIELTQEMQEVINLGVDLIQGYYTSKPKPYILRTIDERVKNEIVQYNQNANAKFFKKVYDLQNEDKASLVQVASSKYTGIRVRHLAGSEGREIAIKGAQGFQPNILMSIENGFRGTIVLDSVSLAGEHGIPCINIGEYCDVTLQLVGENELRTGGIRVPETSVLNIKGEGNLTINLNAGKYYGIGNAVDEHHGTINFLQDGGIIINANGMRGVGIGSGLGGSIYIGRGHYELDIKGQDGVCIGSVDGDTDMRIEYCDMSIYSGISNGTIIGSVNGDAEITIENTSGKLQGAGNLMTGIGTVDGKNCIVHLENVNISSNIRARECYGIGCRNGQTEIGISHAAVKSIVQGKHAVAMGNAVRTAKVCCSNADVSTNAVTDFGSDIGAMEKDISLENGRAEFILNGDVINREIVAAEL